MNYLTKTLFLTESYTRLNVKTLKPIKSKKSPPRWRWFL